MAANPELAYPCDKQTSGDIKLAAATGRVASRYRMAAGGAAAHLAPQPSSAALLQLLNGASARLKTPSVPSASALCMKRWRALVTRSPCARHAWHGACNITWRQRILSTAAANMPPFCITLCAGSEKACLEGYSVRSRRASGSNALLWRRFSLALPPYIRACKQQHFVVAAWRRRRSSGAPLPPHLLPPQHVRCIPSDICRW